MLRLGAASRRRQRLDVFEACFLRPKVNLHSSQRPHDSSDPPAIICSYRLFSSYHNQHGDNSHQQQRRRHRQRSSPRLRISKNNPYDVLGIPRDSSADIVKRKFLQLALRHHPDTNRHSDDTLTHDSSSNKANNTIDTFVKIREAFERIKQDFKNNNDNSDTNSSSSWLTEEEFDAWFYEETGQKMDAATRREVMHVYRSGLTRTEYGAVWEIAFILEEQGFFTHNKEKTLPIPKEKNKEQEGGESVQEDDDNSQTDAGNGRKTNPRRKRGF